MAPHSKATASGELGILRFCSAVALLNTVPQCNRKWDEIVYCILDSVLTAANLLHLSRSVEREILECFVPLCTTRLADNVSRVLLRLSSHLCHTGRSQTFGAIGEALSARSGCGVVSNLPNECCMCAVRIMHCPALNSHILRLPQSSNLQTQALVNFRYNFKISTQVSRCALANIPSPSYHRKPWSSPRCIQKVCRCKSYIRTSRARNVTLCGIYIRNIYPSL